MPSGIPLPKSLWQRLLTSTAATDFANAVLAVPASLVAAFKLEAEGYGWGFYLVPVFVLLLTGRKAYQTYKKDAAEERVHALEGALHVAHRVIMECETIHVDPKLRITIHAVDGASLVQVIDYVGDQRSTGTAGRRTPSHCGIIGLALKTKQLAQGRRSTEKLQDYQDELVSKWLYAPEAAKKLDPHSMSWLAMPLMDSKGKTAAIVFADSVDPDFFTDLRCLFAMTAVAGLSEFVKHRMS